MPTAQGERQCGQGAPSPAHSHMGKHHLAWACPPAHWGSAPPAQWFFSVMGASKELCAAHSASHAVSPLGQGQGMTDQESALGGPGRCTWSAHPTQPGHAAALPGSSNGATPDRANSTQPPCTVTTDPGCPRSRGQCPDVFLSKALHVPSQQPAVVSWADSFPWPPRVCTWALGSFWGHTGLLDMSTV